MATVLNTTPDSEPTATVVASGQTAGDCYGTSTIAFGTEILKVVPPKPAFLSRVNWFSYDCSTTAHTVTMLLPMGKTYVATDAATAQAVVKCNSISTATDGTILAASDYIVVQNENGVYDVYKVASLSGLNVTLTASVGSGDANVITTKLLKNAPVWFMGAVADHVKRQYTMKASTITTFGGAKMALATTREVNQPILVHSNNATATGLLTGPAFEYVKP